MLWEAQYGDFINGAQVILDEFITSGRAKWGLTPSLVLLLPHGYEGQGPDHSSARPERFLEAAADINLRLANCTTAAQYFHLLRRQALLLEDRSAAAHRADAEEPAAPSDGARRRSRELAEGRLHAGDRRSPRRAARAGDVRRLVLCSGKVYVDLVVERKARPTCRDVAIARVEQLYPFPIEELERDRRRRIRTLQEVVWLQEEPQNMGAWEFVRAAAARGLGNRLPLRYVGRPRSASPSEGSSALAHAASAACSSSRRS